MFDRERYICSVLVCSYNYCFQQQPHGVLVENSLHKVFEGAFLPDPVLQLR